MKILKDKVHIKTFFADSDAEYVVLPKIFFPDTQMLKNNKVISI